MQKTDTELSLVYQGRYTIEGVEVGKEALLRVNGGSPLEYIRKLEREGKMWELTMWTLRRVLEDKRDGLEGVVSINVARETFDIAKVDELDREVFNSGVSRSEIEIEITEQGGKDVLEEVQELRKRGYLVYLDDVGSGVNGLLEVVNLEVDGYKVDMGLVRGVDTDVKKQIVLGGLSYIGKQLGKKMVLEGVETQGELNKVKEIVYKQGEYRLIEIQGYVYGRPEKWKN